MKKNRIKDYLKKCASEERVASYDELLNLVNYEVGNWCNDSYRELFNILREIGDECIENDMPVINVLVCNRFRIPGRGFYKWWQNAYSCDEVIIEESVQKKLFEQLKKECFKFYSDEKFKVLKKLFLYQ
jgi:hypothetical protein